ncbi:MAG: PQQ-binding-like beta-propeller repeat protein [Betaproteobacteria bacterium]
MHALSRPHAVRFTRWTIAAALAFTAPLACADGVGWFTTDQVNAGRWAYEQRCGVCHGVNLEGSGAPALRGTQFNAQWNGKTLAQFYSYVHSQMPLGAAGSLKGQDYVNVVSYILSRSGIPAGTQKLTMRSPMARVMVLSDAETATAPSSAAPAGLFVMGALVGTVRQPTTSRPTQGELDGADAATGSWLMYNKGYRGERYSTLARINATNAGRMRALCMYQLGELGTFSTGPVVYDGILYATTHLGTYAIDATTCEKKWSQHHLAVGPEMNATNKGVAIAAGRVVRGTQDGFLFALDAKTGDLLWKRQIADWRVGEGIGAAPTIWNGLVYIAKAGGDWGIQGRMMAFRLEDGAPAWNFDLVPTGNQANADTWKTPGSAEHGGGASWVAYALDRETGTIYIPVGNPGPDYQRAMRQGTNLYTISVVALDAKAGTIQWWYQLRANDDHDWDATNVSLFDAGGRKLVAASGKQGILHVVDRTNGKVVFKLPVTTTLNQDVPLTPEGVRVCPVAGVQWNGAAHSPKTGLLYINAIDWCTVFKLGPEPKWEATVPYTGLANGWGTNDPTDRWSGWINAIDPRKGTMAWRIRTPSPMYAAITPTAGDLLFTGDLEGNFITLDARHGKELYRFNTGGPIAGGVVTWEQKGKQYVAVASGHSGGSIPVSGSTTIVVFGQ